MDDKNTQFTDRMKRVDFKIRGYARFFAFIAPHVEEDDLYQEAMLKLYERYCQEPTFLENNDSYLWCYASWMMKNYLNHERNMYVKHVTDLEPEYCVVPYLQAYFPRPEPEAVRSEVREIASQMPYEYRTIYDGIVQGYEMWEIGDKLHLRKDALSHRKRKMIDTISKAWRVPQSERKLVLREMYG